MANIVKIVPKTITPAVVKIAGIVGPAGSPGVDISSIDGDLLPAIDNQYMLGNSDYRWKSLHVGEGTIFINDAVTNDVVEITISDGVFFIDGIAQAQLPNIKVTNLTFNDNTVQTTAYVPPAVTRWSPVFQATGLTFTGSGNTYPTYNSYYVKNGQMVTFWIAVDMTTVTNFGTGQFKLQLPFLPYDDIAAHFSAWCWINPALPPDDLNGHVQLVADHLPGSQTLDLHWLQAAPSNPKPVIETLLSQGSPLTFTTASKLYVNGTYIAAS